jgi:hypothetical protein
MDKFSIEHYEKDGKKLHELRNDTTGERLMVSEYEGHIEYYKRQLEAEAA